MGDRPVQWGYSPFAYDGHERTIMVFNAEAGEQLALLKGFRATRRELEVIVGGPFIILFFNRNQTERHHTKAVRAWERART